MRLEGAQVVVGHIGLALFPASEVDADEFEG